MLTLSEMLPLYVVEARMTDATVVVRRQLGRHRWFYREYSGEELVRDIEGSYDHVVCCDFAHDGRRRSAAIHSRLAQVQARHRRQRAPVVCVQNDEDI